MDEHAAGDARGEARQARRSAPASIAQRADVLIVGGGQAGLAAARAALARGLDCVVVERHPRIGDSWRTRFDSLVLFTTRRLSALSGLALDGDPGGYPSKDELGDYLERYAEGFSLPVVTGNGVARLVREGDGFIAALADGASVSSRAAIIATGGFQRPRVPSFSRELAPDVQQLDPSSYRNPAQIDGRRVMVVGDGATGRQIARELAPGRSVMLSTGRRRNFGPQRLLSADTTDLSWRAGFLTADKDSLVGRTVRALDVTPGWDLRLGALRRAGVDVVPRCAAADGRALVLEDGSRREIDAVIFAMGYRDDTDWLRIPDASDRERFVHDRGVGTVPGLLYVGREWQTCRASGLICGASRDAEAIVAQCSAGQVS